MIASSLRLNVDFNDITELLAHTSEISFNFVWGYLCQSKFYDRVDVSCVEFRNGRVSRLTFSFIMPGRTGSTAISTIPWHFIYYSQLDNILAYKLHQAKITWLAGNNQVTIINILMRFHYPKYKLYQDPLCLFVNHREFPRFKLYPYLTFVLATFSGIYITRKFYTDIPDWLVLNKDRAELEHKKRCYEALVLSSTGSRFP